jgi:hypothetical protein
VKAPCLADRVARFEAICREHPYRDKGIFYSEAFLFLEACRWQRVNALVESGVKGGMSTQLLRAAFAGEMTSIDQVPCRVPAGVTFVRGDAFVAIAPILRARPHARVGILIDGPKGTLALALKDRCFEYPQVRFVAIHDQPRGHGEAAHSHNRGFRSDVGTRLDALIASDYAAKYPSGPGLALWFAQGPKA